MKKGFLLAGAVFVFAFMVFSGNQRALRLISMAKSSLVKGDSAAAVRYMEEAIMVLKNGMPLRITNLHLCDRIRGFGDFVPKPSNSLNRGEALLIYFEVENPGVKKVGNKYAISLTEDARILTPKGKVLFERKNWTNLKGLFATPSIPVYFQNRITGIPKGKYIFEITINDLVKKTFTTKTYEFTVK